MNRIAKWSLLGGTIVLVGTSLVISQELQRFEANLPPDTGVHIPDVPQRNYEYPVFSIQPTVSSATGTFSTHNLGGRIIVTNATGTYSI